MVANGIPQQCLNPDCKNADIQLMTEESGDCFCVCMTCGAAGQRAENRTHAILAFKMAHDVLRTKTEIPSPYAMWMCAELHGWHNPPADLNTDLLLIHAEVSEATEGARLGLLTSADGKGPKDEGSVGEELADAVIRIFHTCRKNGIDIEAEIKRKFAINMTRPFRHGDKLF